jgi:hypothetical protein
MRDHPSVPGELLAATTAERLGQQIFGALLDRQMTIGPAASSR